MVNILGKNSLSPTSLVLMLQKQAPSFKHSGKHIEKNTVSPICLVLKLQKQAPSFKHSGDRGFTSRADMP